MLLLSFFYFSVILATNLFLAQVTITLNSGSTGSATTSSLSTSDHGFIPIQTNYYKQKSQYVVRGTELSAASEGFIESIALNISVQPGRDMTGFNIKMKHTSSNTTNTIFEEDLQTVYTRSTQLRSELATGWSTFTFDTPFYWDGTSNVLIEFCWDNGSSWTNAGGVHYHVPFGSSDPVSRYFNTDGAANTACAYPASAGSTSTSWWRPQFRFVIDEVTVSSPLFYNTGLTQQVVFNNARILLDEPVFAVSTSSTTGSIDAYEVEVNSAPDFSGVAYTQIISGSFVSEEIQELKCDNLNPTFEPSQGEVFYVRARASDDGQVSWSEWSTRVHVFTFSDLCEDAWFQTTKAQFDNNDLEGIRTNEATNDYMDVDVITEFEVGNKDRGGSSSLGDQGFSGGEIALTPIEVDYVTHATAVEVFFTSLATAVDQRFWQGIYELDGTTLNLLSETGDQWIGGTGYWISTSLQSPVLLEPTKTYYLAYRSRSAGNKIGLNCNAEIGHIFGSGGPTMTRPDPFEITSIGGTSTCGLNVAVVGTALGGLSTTNAGTLVQFESFFGAESWGELQWEAEENGGSILIELLYDNGVSLSSIPNSDLPGNEDGYEIAQSPVDLSNLDVTVYNNLYLRVSMENGTSSPGPRLYSWGISVEKQKSEEPTEIIGDEIYCGVAPVSLSIIDGVLAPGHQWGWYDDAGLSNLIHTGTEFEVSPTVTTTYFVAAFDVNNCIVSESISKTVVADPISTNIVGQNINVDDYLWSGNTNGSWSNSSNWFKRTTSGYEVPMLAPEVSSNVFIFDDSDVGDCISSTHPLVDDLTPNCRNLFLGSNATLEFVGSNELSIYRHLINNGNLIAAAGTVKFLGDAMQLFNGSSVTTFHNLELDNDLDADVNLELNQDIIVTGDLILTNGRVKMNQKVIDLGSTGKLVAENNDNYVFCECPSAYVRATGFVNDAGVTYNLGNLGLEITPSTGKPLGNVEIIRKHQRVSGANGMEGESISRVYETKAVGGGSVGNNGDLDATIAMHYLNHELNGTPEEDLIIYRQPDLSENTWFEYGGTVDMGAQKVVYSGWDAFSGGTLNGDPSVLPVSFLGMQYACEGNRINLSWQTVSEWNAMDFLVERSSNGVDWAEVGSIQATGNTNATTNYEFLDNRAPTGLNYYRLVQRDFDGEQEIFGPISANCSELVNNAFAYPNPSNGQFVVEISSETADGDVLLLLTDANGRLVDQRFEHFTKGTTSLHYQINVEKGIYILRIQDKNGNFKPLKINIH